MNSLVLFVDSERADQYLNPIVYSVLSLDVRRVTFVHIRGLLAREESGGEQGLSGRALGAVQAQLEGLAERGEYLFTTAEQAGERRLLADIYGEQRAHEIRVFYRQCRNAPLAWGNEEISYSELRKCMHKIAKLGSSVYIDVTAIKKRYLGDLVAASLVEGIEGLYTFDLVGVSPNFKEPWRMLIHELDERSSTFSYVNLLNTDVYRSCVRLVAWRAPALKVSLFTTVALLAAVVVMSQFLGPETVAIRTMFAVSALASILSLVFYFVPPRAR